VALGSGALFNNRTGIGNTAVGPFTLKHLQSGNGNTALGSGAGDGVTTATGVICIGIQGADVSNSCYIGNIFSANSSGGTAVFINSVGKLGTTTSSRRFKEEIKPMERISEALFALRPVTFRYKQEIDPNGAPQFGLVAEEVEKVNPDLVVRDKEGKPYSVRYDQVNAMLLNEFLKEHRKVEQLTRDFNSKLVEQQKQIEALTAGLQKMSAQLEANKPAPQVVNNP
jgi:Chaperone of endosialidase